MAGSQLFFLSDIYYQDFPDDKLMKNKDVIDGVLHNRPCFFAFPDSKYPSIYWIVPISSKYEKYKRIAQSKIEKYGKCNTIRFGTVLGRKAAFLIQNICPATEKYLTAYIDKNHLPIQIDNRIAEDVTKNARDVLAMAKRGAKVVFPDIFTIYHALEKQLLSEKQTSLDNYDPVTGKPIDKTYLEKGLPGFLTESIADMIRIWDIMDNGGRDNHWDAYWCNLNADINCAEVEQMITSEQAWYLRRKYLRLED